jgi:ECF transporter S component (folate family)
MHKFKAIFISSYHELKSLECITLLGMLGAMSIILGYFTYMPSEFLKITFNFLPNEFAFYLFGPVTGMVYGAALDILTFIIKPTGTFFFGFTLSAILAGLIYGFMLYKKPISLTRIIIANLIHAIAISVLLNTYWLTILYGYNFIALLPIRALKAIIALPIESIMLFLLIKAAKAAGILKFYKQGHNY